MNISKIVKAAIAYVTSLPSSVLIIAGIALLAVVVIAVAAIVVAVVLAKKRKKTAVDKKFRVVEEIICTDSNGVIFD